MLSELEGFTKDVRGPLTQTINNTKVFTDALAKNAKVVDELGANAGNINQIITDAKDMMDRLNKASVHVNDNLVKTDKMLSTSDKDSVAAQAKATLESIRQTSDNLNKRLGPIADNLQRFSGQGLRDVQSAVVDSSRSIQRIEQAITDLERNPQRIIFGGQGSVPQYDGRTRH